MPPQPQATSARSSAGRLAPRVPNEARQNTGNGMPYFVPAWALSTIGTRTIRLPRKIVAMACDQFMPPPMSDDASMYVGMHADIEIHSAAKLSMPHLRRARRDRRQIGVVEMALLDVRLDIGGIAAQSGVGR